MWVPLSSNSRLEGFSVGGCASATMSPPSGIGSWAMKTEGRFGESMRGALVSRMLWERSGVRKVLDKRSEGGGGG